MHRVAGRVISWCSCFAGAELICTAKLECLKGDMSGGCAAAAHPPPSARKARRCVLHT
jgi:hypothetical protein